MIKLTQVKTILGKATLLFNVDFPDGTTKTVEVDVGELEDRLKQLRQLLGCCSQTFAGKVVALAVSG
jgi:hypothetical protein